MAKGFIEAFDQGLGRILDAIIHDGPALVANAATATVSAAADVAGGLFNAGGQMLAGASDAGPAPLGKLGRSAEFYNTPAHEPTLAQDLGHFAAPTLGIQEQQSRGFGMSA